MSMRLSLVALGVLSCVASVAQAEPSSLTPIAITLAKTYQSSIDISEYWQSEKLDGIRAIWNGKALMTRKGNPIAAPSWFIQKLPKYPLEGELWAGRGNFHLVQQTVLDGKPNHDAWQKISLMLFDAPLMADSYQERYFSLVELVSTLKLDHINYIEHTPIHSEQQLLTDLDEIEAAHGEGLMLRKFSSHYQVGRNDDLLKLKKHQDTEAVVIGYKTGNGKYKDKMGALLVKLDSGQEFYIGSGFSDAQRESPPRLGTSITFRFNGYTNNGIPKFARYVRDRVE